MEYKLTKNELKNILNCAVCNVKDFVMNEDRFIDDWIVSNKPTITNFIIDNKNQSDHPKFCDAYISEAHINGRLATELELEMLNNDSDLLAKLVQDY